MDRVDRDLHNEVPGIESLLPHLPDHWVEHEAAAVEGSELDGRVMGPYVAETYPISVEERYVVVDL